MQVTRIAETKLTDPTFGGVFSQEGDVTDADHLTEGAGRACYESWSRPNEVTRKNADYIRSTVHEKKHESITAHASVTYYITGVSRALTHEMIRHRWLAFSELSQRYVDIEDMEFIDPPALRGVKEWPRYKSAVAKVTRFAYKALVGILVPLTGSRKKAREAARAVFPNMTETRIVVTGNMRAWRDFIAQRWSQQADAEIRELAGLILADLRKVAPNTFADVPEEPYQ